MTTNVTYSATPAYSSTVTVAGRNEVAAETQPLSVVQKLLDNDYVNPWSAASDATIWIAVKAFNIDSGFWGIIHPTGVIPALIQENAVTTSVPICDISAILPPNVSGKLKLKGASVSLAPSALHSALPVSMPQLDLSSYPSDDYSTTESLTSIQTATDTSATLGAYEDPHLLSLTCSHLIVPTERYFLRILGEYATNAIDSLLISNVKITVGY